MKEFAVVFPELSGDVEKISVERIAEDHWEYIRELLLTHGEDEDVVEKCGFHYVSAFIHGHKHAKEK